MKKEREREREELGVGQKPDSPDIPLKGKMLKQSLPDYQSLKQKNSIQMCEEYQIPLNKFIKRVLNRNEGKAGSDHSLTHQANS